ncbi:MAG: hypothetical protein KIT25_21115 [Enhydrobacter sp.]|nr:MAG: hypothetical protein KIT25_21115 [Enhydrobacter sp.]
MAFPYFVGESLVGINILLLERFPIFSAFLQLSVADHAAREARGDDAGDCARAPTCLAHARTIDIALSCSFAVL